MDQELQAYKDWWESTPKEERNALAEAMADAYVAAHPELAQRYGALELRELVALVDIAREQGDQDRVWELEIYINAAFEYQVIGGTIDTERRSDLTRAATAIETTPPEGVRR